MIAATRDTGRLRYIARVIRGGILRDPAPLLCPASSPSAPYPTIGVPPHCYTPPPPKKSHVIQSGNFSRRHENVAIPTTLFHTFKWPRGNYVRHNGLPLRLAGSRATNKPHQTMNPPKCRRIQPKPSFLAACHPMGLHFGRNNAPDRGSDAT